METDASSRDVPMWLPLRPARLRAQRIGFALATALPLLGVVVAAFEVGRIGFTTVEAVTSSVMMVVSGVGIEAGFHRHFSHRAFAAKPWVRVALAIAGTTALQGPVLYWVANHRLHHAHSDTPDDPHSPHASGRGRLSGLLHAHLGWIFGARRPSPGRFARDLLRDPLVVWVSRRHLWWVAAGLLAPAVLGWAMTGTALGAWRGLLWGGFVRIFVAQHTTYLVNSACHTIGRRPFASGDRSTNLRILALPTFGGSMHNNHHAFPSTATNDFTVWELDPSGWFVRLLAATGLAWDLKRPTAAQRKRRRT